jgi:hypothetical protein
MKIEVESRRRRQKVWYPNRAILQPGRGGGISFDSRGRCYVSLGRGNLLILTNVAGTFLLLNTTNLFLQALLRKECPSMAVLIRHAGSPTLRTE